MTEPQFDEQTLHQSQADIEAGRVRYLGLPGEMQERKKIEDDEIRSLQAEVARLTAEVERQADELQRAQVQIDEATDFYQRLTTKLEELLPTMKYQSGDLLHNASCAIETLKAQVEQSNQRAVELTRERDSLCGFKELVHAKLNKLGVPPMHGEPLRIGQRLHYVERKLSDLAKQEARIGELERESQTRLKIIEACGQTMRDDTARNAALTRLLRRWLAEAIANTGLIEETERALDQQEGRG